jgi:hypothetical protein
MTRGSAAKAEPRLIVWCRGCGYQVEPARPCPWRARRVREPAFNIVPRLVVTFMIRPQPSRIISGTTAFASAKGAVVCTATKRRH